MNKIDIQPIVVSTLKMPVQRLNQFKKDFQSIQLADYYQLNSVPYQHIHIQKDVREDNILLTIRYQKTHYLPNIRIPLELIKLVGQYLSFYIEIHTKIEYSTHYPFAPPIWYMEGVKHNLYRSGYGPLYLLDYYIRQINGHNHLYNLYLLNGWNPAITVEKDILIFVQRIFHFNEML